MPTNKGCPGNALTPLGIANAAVGLEFHLLQQKIMDIFGDQGDVIRLDKLPKWLAKDLRDLKDEFPFLYKNNGRTNSIAKANAAILVIDVIMSKLAPPDQEPLPRYSPPAPRYSSPAHSYKSSTLTSSGPKGKRKARRQQPVRAKKQQRVKQ